MALSETQNAAQPNPVLDIANSIPAMICGQIELHGNETILRKKDRGIWKAVTWKELGASIRRIGMALQAISFKPGEIACILADTSPAWVTTDLGIQSARGICAGIYTTDTLAQVEAVLADCHSGIVFIDNEEQLDKILQVRERCPDLKRIVIFNVKGLRDFDDPMCESLETFLARGDAYNAAHLGDWEAGIAAIAPADGAVLTYTSGTTGTPQGVILSHRSILAQISSTTALLDQRPGDERLAFLPMAHFMERILGLYQSLYSGTVSNYVESAETVIENLREVMPSVLYAPPRIWERMFARATVAVGDATMVQRKLYQWAMSAGQRLADARRAGDPSLWQRSMAALGSVLVLRNVRRAAGIDEVRIGGIGGAPVSPDLVRWFSALGIDLIEFYGLSEGAGLVATVPPARSIQRAPQPLACCGDLEISPAGEILLRGDHVFSGYWRNGASTGRSGSAEWYPTGDTARLENGALRITGRNCDAIQTTSGRKVMPAEAEAALKFSPYIADALVFGDRREFLGCLVMIDHENVEKWAQDQKVVFTGFANLARTEAVRGLIEREIQRANSKLEEPIRAFRLIEQKLESEDPELSPMMKLRRQFVSEKYRDLIDDMYCDASTPTGNAAKMAQRH